MIKKSYEKRHITKDIIQKVPLTIKSNGFEALFAV